jgi:hypothetical protein
MIKKFSKITGQKINEQPKVEQKFDEVDELKLEMMNLMDSFLKVRLEGPVHNKLMFGAFSIAGKDLLAEAILSLLNDKTSKDKTKVLESLKNKISDWESIDSEIEEINKKRPSINKFNRVNKLIEKYSSDEDTLIMFVESTVNKLKNQETIKEYSQIVSESRLSQKTKDKLNFIYNERIKQINSEL